MDFLVHFMLLSIGDSALSRDAYDRVCSEAYDKLASQLESGIENFKTSVMEIDSKLVCAVATVFNNQPSAKPGFIGRQF